MNVFARREITGCFYEKGGAGFWGRWLKKSWEYSVNYDSEGVSSDILVLAAWCQTAQF